VRAGDADWTRRTSGRGVPAGPVVAHASGMVSFSGIDPLRAAGVPCSAIVSFAVTPPLHVLAMVAGVLAVACAAILASRHRRERPRVAHPIAAGRPAMGSITGGAR